IAADTFMAANWLTDGRYPIAINADRSRIDELQASGIGKEIEFFKFSGESTLTRGVSVLRHNPSPNATKVFLHWLLSKEGATSFSESIQQNVRRKDVPVFDESMLVDWDELDKYSLQGTEKGGEHVLEV